MKVNGVSVGEVFVRLVKQYQQIVHKYAQPMTGYAMHLGIKATSSC